MSLGPPILLTSARSRDTSVCSLKTLAISSLMACTSRQSHCQHGYLYQAPVVFVSMRSKLISPSLIHCLLGRHSF